jgi:hypothetical protein
LLERPLAGRTRDLRLDTAALLLVFDAPEMVDALYAGERRQAPGRTDYNAKVHVFVVEVPPSEGFEYRRLKMLSVHAGPHANHRVEVRRLLLDDNLELEALLQSGWNDGVQPKTKQMNVAVAGAKRTEDRGFYGARVPFYRAVIGALQRIAAKHGLTAHSASGTASAEVSRLPYQSL